MVESYGKGETKKQARELGTEELEEFLKKADNKDRYWLARKAASVIAYCGGNRIHEIRALTMDDVKPVENGYHVQFQHAKQRAQLVKSQ